MPFTFWKQIVIHLTSDHLQENYIIKYMQEIVALSKTPPQLCDIGY